MYLSNIFIFFTLKKYIYIYINNYNYEIILKEKIHCNEFLIISKKS